MKTLSPHNRLFLMAAAAFAIALLCCVFFYPSRDTHPTAAPTQLLPMEENPMLEHTKEQKAELEHLMSEIDFYMRSHSILDEGYDIVLRRRDLIAHSIDSLTLMVNAMERYDSPARLFFVLKDEQPALPESIDTIVTIRDGIAYIQYPDNSYYEGQFTDTLYEGASAARRVRHGVGVLFGNKRLQAGTWHNDVYKGELPTYTAHHVYGIDISRWQHEPSGKARKPGAKQPSYPIDWNHLRITSLGTKSDKRIEGKEDYPVSFIYIKSTEGVSIRNRYYASDYAQSRKHGYRTGSYHFFSPKTRAQDQAAYFIRNTYYNEGDLPPVLDVEPLPSEVAKMGGAGAMLQRVRTWLDAVERHYKVRPILYVSQKFVNTYLQDGSANATYIRDNYHFWIAQYGKYKPHVQLLFWQLSSDGRVTGIRFPVDINIFNGYADTFNGFKFAR